MGMASTTAAAARRACLLRALRALLPLPLPPPITAAAAAHLASPRRMRGTAAHSVQATHQRTRLMGLPVYRPQMRAVSRRTQMATSTEQGRGRVDRQSNNTRLAVGLTAPCFASACAGSILLTSTSLPSPRHQNKCTPSLCASLTDAAGAS